MSIQKRLITIFAIGLVLLAPLTITGCISMHPSCGGASGWTAIRSGQTVQHNVNQGDAHITNWTHALIMTNITIGQSKVIQVNHTFSTQLQNSSMESLQFNQSAGYERVHHLFTLGAWTPFTISLTIKSDDAALANYAFFNGSNTASGQIRVKDIGSDNHKIVYDITLDKDYTNLRVVSPENKVILSSADWTYDILALSYSPVTC